MSWAALRLTPALMLGFLPLPSHAAGTADAITAFIAKPEHRQAITATAVEAFKKLQGCDSALPAS